MTLQHAPPRLRLAQGNQAKNLETNREYRD